MNKTVKRILLIGDDGSVVRLVRANIEKVHPEMKVESAMSGVQGMQMIDSPGQAFDLVIVTTLLLSDVPSYEILEHLRRMYPGVKVLVLSGGPNPPDACPMHAFLAKPVLPDTLVRMVEQLMAT